MSAPRLFSRLTEEHGGPIYAVSFNSADLNHKDLFATVGAACATIYLLDSAQPLKVVQAYEDENPKEEFWTCEWLVDEETGAPLLAVAGKEGVIKVVDCTRLRVTKALMGHGNSINDLKLHPRDSGLLFSSSNDYGVKMWSLETQACVVTFAGKDGHCDSVVSLDLHPTGDFLLSSGVENYVHLWDLREPKLREYVDQARHERKEDLNPIHIQTPHYSTNKAHKRGSYVDVVRWVGDLVLTRGTDERVVLWQLPTGTLLPATEPDTSHSALMPADTPSPPLAVVQECTIPNSNLFSLRFNLDFQSTAFAIGNIRGDVWLFDVSKMNNKARTKLPTPNMKCTAVRDTALSFSHSHVVAVCNDASILVWQLPHEQLASQLGSVSTNGLYMKHNNEGHPKRQKCNEQVRLS